MKIAIDVDVTLTDMNSFIKNKGEKFFSKKGKKILNSDATTVELMFDATEKESKEFWNKYYLDYCLNVKFREHLKDSLKSLKESGHSLNVVTSRFWASRNDIIGKTVRSLVKRKFKQNSIVMDSYTFTDDDIESDKLNACIANHFDVVVEDNPKHIEQISNTMGIPVIVVDTPENKNINANNIFRINSLDELPSAIKKVEKFYEDRKNEQLKEYENKPKTGMPSIDRPWEREYIELGIRKYILQPNCNKFSFWKMRNKWYPNDIAYSYCYGKKFTNAEYEKLVYECAKSIASLGVKQGSIITIVTANLVEYKIIDEACNILGITLNVMHPFTKYDELKKRMNNIEVEKNSKVLFILDSAYEELQSKGDIKEFANKIVILNPKDNMTLKGMVEYIIDEKKLKSKVKVKVPSKHSEKAKIVYSDNILKFKDFLSLGKNIGDLESYVAEFDINRPTKILYTGGTTSDKPKGVVLTDKNYLAMILGYEQLANFNRREVMNTVTPVFHGFGDCNCTDMPKAFGVEVQLSPKFNSYNFIRNIKKYKDKTRINIMCTPTLFNALSKNETFRLIRDCDYGYLCTGGALLTNENKEQFEKAFKHLFTVGYGATETLASSLFTFMYDEKEGYIGIPLLGVIVKIVKPGTEEEVGYNTEGEICISGDIVFTEYYNNSEDTAKALKKHSDGKIWYHSSDLGEINEKGHVFYKTRLDDCVTYNGYNVYLDDIDTILERNNIVEESLTISIDDKEHGNIPISCVKLSKDLNNEKVIEILLSSLKESSLPAYSIPKKIIVVDDIPKSVYGKKSRYILKQIVLGDIEKQKVKVYGK